MLKNNSLKERIKSVDSSTFEETAIAVFNHQYQSNVVYKRYVDSLGRDFSKVQRLHQIPFMPISFFKHFEIKTGEWEKETVFESSGTTGTVSSKHHIRDEAYYLEGCMATFEEEYGSISQYQVLALLPSYLERGNSGLISMVNSFIHEARPGSGFYLNELDELYQHLNKAKREGIPTILWGVTFALLDFAEVFQMDFPDLIVMETGGMKGRRKEMIRADIHHTLHQAFGVSRIHSEYGMTELFSQAYSKGEGIYRPSRLMQVVPRDLNDPFDYPFKGRRGGLNIIDLANYDSCSFIETQDMGIVYEDDSFEVLGRIDNSEMRGCNLMIS